MTVPCQSSETAYRTFDSAFAVERNDGNFPVKMRYYHNALRERDTFHSEYGAAGFCRKGVYGMPRYITNTMRICTRDAANVQYDATVPVKPKYTNDTEQFSDDEHCSDNPFTTPWFVLPPAKIPLTKAN